MMCKFYCQFFFYFLNFRFHSFLSKLQIALTYLTIVATDYSRYMKIKVTDRYLKKNGLEQEQLINYKSHGQERIQCELNINMCVC